MLNHECSVHAFLLWVLNRVKIEIRSIWTNNTSLWCFQGLVILMFLLKWITSVLSIAIKETARYVYANIFFTVGLFSWVELGQFDCDTETAYFLKECDTTYNISLWICNCVFSMVMLHIFNKRHIKNRCFIYVCISIQIDFIWQNHFPDNLRFLIVETAKQIKQSFVQP